MEFLLERMTKRLNTAKHICLVCEEIRRGVDDVQYHMEKDHLYAGNYFRCPVCPSWDNSTVFKKVSFLVTHAAKMHSHIDKEQIKAGAIRFRPIDELVEKVFEEWQEYRATKRITVAAIDPLISK